MIETTRINPLWAAEAEPLEPSGETQGEVADPVTGFLGTGCVGAGGRSRDGPFGQTGVDVRERIGGCHFRGNQFLEPFTTEPRCRYPAPGPVNSLESEFVRVGATGMNKVYQIGERTFSLDQDKAEKAFEAKKNRPPVGGCQGPSRLRRGRRSLLVGDHRIAINGECPMLSVSQKGQRHQI